MEPKTKNDEDFGREMEIRNKENFEGMLPAGMRRHGRQWGSLLDSRIKY